MSHAGPAKLTSHSETCQNVIDNLVGNWLCKQPAQVSHAGPSLISYTNLTAQQCSTDTVLGSKASGTATRICEQCQAWC